MEIEEAHRVFSTVFLHRCDFRSGRQFVRVFGGIDGFNVWNATYLGDLCLIAGTVIRSGGCALSPASLWLRCF